MGKLYRLRSRFHYVVIGKYRPHDPKIDPEPVYFDRKYQAWQPVKCFTAKSYYTLLGAIRRLKKERRKRNPDHGIIDDMDILEHHTMFINNHLCKDKQRFLRVV